MCIQGSLGKTHFPLSSQTHNQDIQGWRGLTKGCHESPGNACLSIGHSVQEPTAALPLLPPAWMPSFLHLLMCVLAPQCFRLIQLKCMDLKNLRDLPPDGPPPLIPPLSPSLTPPQVSPSLVHRGVSLLAVSLLKRLLLQSSL